MPWLPPLLLHYYITGRCNSRCGICDIWRESTGASARLEDVARNLASAARLGLRFVDFTGGEPLLHPDLAQMLKLARSAGLRTTLTTNTLLYPERAAELAGLVDFLHFSLDAASADDHDQLRGVPCFAAVMTSIDRARQYGERPDILFTAQSSTLHHLPHLAEFCQRLGLILIVNPVFSHRQLRELSSADLAVIEQYACKPFVYVNRALHRLRRQGGNHTTAPRCRVVDGVVVISPQNELILPCFHHEAERIPLDPGLEAVWKGAEVYRQRLMQGRRSECEGCTLNCYFDPSFTYRFDRFFVQSLAAKAKYSIEKYLRHPLMKSARQMDLRPAAAIMAELQGSQDSLREAL
ncbi:MAG TPA: radical SAM protein [bacterium]|nr:radical SAM protein [bacterium]HQG45349.1 radical SAM protein [bacterium]HQI47775.1 radical SAM protein [bacterium]HQJ63205.1 radical SAM protein [bacterium]